MAGLGRRLSLECVAFAAVRNEMLCLATAGTDRPTIQVGQRVPLLAPFGVVFVAWSAPAVVDAWLRRSGIDRARATHAAAALETVRERGFSATLDRPEYREIERLVVELGDRPHAPELWQALRGRIAGVDRAEFGPTRSGRRRQRVRDITAPVFDDAGRPAIALTVQGFDGPRRSSDIEEIAAALLEVTRRVGDESHV
jgi:DNA-binding IclR family transcriptional regulator